MKQETRFSLRIPTDLYEFIRDKATKSGMSINEYIILSLQRYHDLDLLNRLTQLEATVARLAAVTQDPHP